MYTVEITAFFYLFDAFAHLIPDESGDFHIFAQGFGRFDLYSGDGRTLMKSLESLKALPGHLPIYPGHGGSVILSQALNYLDI